MRKPRLHDSAVCGMHMQEIQSAADDPSGSIEAMLAEEVLTRVHPDYLCLQPHIGPEHRQFLVSWIVTVRLLAPKCIATQPPSPYCASHAPAAAKSGSGLLRRSEDLQISWLCWCACHMESAACFLQAAACLNYGVFTSTVAVNLLDRFIATQHASVSPVLPERSSGTLCA